MLFEEDPFAMCARPRLPERRGVASVEEAICELAERFPTRIPGFASIVARGDFRQAEQYAAYSHETTIDEISPTRVEELRAQPINVLGLAMTFSWSPYQMKIDRRAQGRSVVRGKTDPENIDQTSE